MDLSVHLIYNNTDVDLLKEQSNVEAHHNCFRRQNWMLCIYCVLRLLLGHYFKDKE